MPSLLQSRFAPRTASSSTEAQTRQGSNVDNKENLEKFLARLNFNVDLRKDDQRPPDRVSSRTSTRGHQVEDLSPSPTSAVPARVGEVTDRHQPSTASLVADRQNSFKEAVHNVAAGLYNKEPAIGKYSAMTSPVGSPPTHNQSVAYTPTAAGTGSNGKPMNSLPLEAIAFTLRSSSRLGPVAPGPAATPRASGLNESRFAIEQGSIPTWTRAEEFERRTNEALAKQESINRRIEALKAQRDQSFVSGGFLQPEAVTKRDSEEQAKRQADIESKRQAELEAARVEAERKEAERLEVERLEVERKETARREAEREAIRKEIKAKEAAHEEAERKQAELKKQEDEMTAKREAKRAAEVQERLELERREALRRETTARVEAQRQAEEAKEAERAEALRTEKDKKAKVEAALHELSRQRSEQQQELIKKRAETENEVEMAKQRLSTLGHEREQAQKQLDEAKAKLAKLDQEQVEVQKRLDNATTSLTTIGQEEEDTKRVSEEKKMQLEQERQTLEESCHRLEQVGSESSTAPIVAESFPDSPVSTITPQDCGFTRPFPQVDRKIDRVIAAFLRDIDRMNVKTEHELQFTAWPKPAERPEGPAKVRRIRLTNLPTKSTVASVLSLVWGGRVERLLYTPGSASAQVLFMKHEDCMDYYNATSNGIELPGNTNHVVMVDLAPIAEPVSGFLLGCIQSGATRCVRVIGIDKEWGYGGLMKLAEGNGRTLERVMLSTNERGHRIAEFRFTNLQDAMKFTMQIQRDEDFEETNIQFVDDPCATHNGIHNVTK